jgi:hypothetical protein
MKSNSIASAAVGSLLIPALLCLLGGCSFLQLRTSERVEFSFSPQFPSVPPPPNAPGLSIRLFEAAPQFERENFVFRLGSTRWETDFYRVFADPPATLLTAATRRWMAHSGLFSRVAIPGLGTSQNWNLEGFVNDIHGDYREPDQPKAVLEMKFTLQAPGSSRSSTPLLTKTYREVTPLEINSPTGLVDAWSRNFEKIMRQLVADMRPVLARPIPATTAASE